MRDESENVWFTLQRDARGIDNHLGGYFIEVARKDLQKFSALLAIRTWPLFQRARSNSMTTPERLNARRTFGGSVAA